jgi:hypothetical protein
MCDYSLEMYASRPAREGETYVITRFPSGSVGLASAGDPKTAVCVQCDTQLVLSDIPNSLQLLLGVRSNEKVIFTRLDHGVYRDGVKFENGRTASLQQLRAGIRVHVSMLLENAATARQLEVEAVKWP